MASATYQTKLTADTTQHDQALGRSAKQVYNYKKECDKTDASVAKLGKGFTKLAGAFSAAKIASDLFKSSLRENQNMADKYGESMQAMKSITSEFAYSLSHMSFKNFFDGLGNIVSRAKEAYDALDNLHTLQTVLFGSNAKLEADYSEALRRLKAGDMSAIQELNRVVGEMEKNNNKERAATLNSFTSLVREKTTVDTSVKGHNGHYEFANTEYGMNQVMGLVSNAKALERTVKNLENEYKQLEKKAKGYNRGNDIWTQVANAKAKWEAYGRLYDRLSDGENLEKLTGYYASYQSKRGANADLEARTNQMIERYTKKFGQDYSPQTTWHATVEADINLPEGSIAALEKEIQDLRDKYNMAITDEGENGRHNLLKKIQEAQKELDKLKFDPSSLLPEGSMAYLEQKLKELQNQWKLAITDADRQTVKEQIDQIQEEIDRINGTIKVAIEVESPRDELKRRIEELRRDLEFEGDSWNRIAIGFNIDKLTQDLARLDESLKTPAEKIKDRINELKQGFEDLGDICTNACDAMASAFNAFANTGDETTDRVMKNTATLISQIGSLIPKILSMIAAYEAEAMAAGTASAAAIGFPQNIAAITSIIAELMAVFGTIASFTTKAYASGGIIDGASRVGDMNIARVNAGEMILNGTQQARLFRLLNGEVGPQQMGSSGGNVVFRISGTDLVGILNNHEKKNRRVR